jgi:nucleoside transporter
MSEIAAHKAHPFVAGRLSAMMFLEFFVWGGWFVTMSGYMVAHEMGDWRGWAYSMCPIAAIFSPFFLGMIADRFFATERVLAVLHLLGGVALCLAPLAAQAAGAYAFLALILLHALCYMPTLGLTNSLAFQNLTNQEKQFPLIRVFGTIGWIVAVFLVSSVLGKDKAAMQFYIAGGAGLLMGLYSLTLPHTPPPAKGKAFSIRDALGLDSLSMLRDKNYLVFILACLLICIPLAVYYSQTQLFVDAAGAVAPGGRMTWGQVSEIFFMLIMPLCFVRLGIKWMLGVGMLAWVVRYGLFALGAPSMVWWMIMGGILLHGVCYDFFFVTGFIYCDKRADVRVRSQAQGFLVLITQGVGMLIGQQVGQRLFKVIVTAPCPAVPAEFNEMTLGQTLAAIGAKLQSAVSPEQMASLTKLQHDLLAWQSAVLPQWQRFWIIPCIAAAVVLVLFALFFRNPVSKPAEPGGV